jgi:hypothetical protein
VPPGPPRSSSYSPLRIPFLLYALSHTSPTDWQGPDIDRGVNDHLELTRFRALRIDPPVPCREFRQSRTDTLTEPDTNQLFASSRHFCEWRVGNAGLCTLKFVSQLRYTLAP